MDALLVCVGTKESVLFAVGQTLWNGSDAPKLSIPTGEGRHLYKKQFHVAKRLTAVIDPWGNSFTL